MVSTWLFWPCCLVSNGQYLALLALQLGTATTWSVLGSSGPAATGLTSPVREGTARTMSRSSAAPCCCTGQAVSTSRHVTVLIAHHIHALRRSWPRLAASNNCSSGVSGAQQQSIFALNVDECVKRGHSSAAPLTGDTFSWWMTRLPAAATSSNTSMRPATAHWPSVQPRAITFGTGWCGKAAKLVEW